MDLVMDCSNFRIENKLPPRQGKHWKGGSPVPSTGLPLEESNVSIYLTVGTPWEVVDLDAPNSKVPSSLPAGRYRLTFKPNSPAALKELIIDPDPGPGETF